MKDMIIISVIDTVLLIIVIMLLVSQQPIRKYKNTFRRERLIKAKSKVKTEFIVDDPHHDNQAEWRFYDGWFYHKLKTQKEWIVVKNIHPTPERIMALCNLINQAIAEKRKQAKNQKNGT